MFERTKLLLGTKAVETLQNSVVAVIGVGGVGSIAAEALARSGVGTIVLVDNDDISISNLNRQVQTDMYNIGRSKVLEMEKFIRRINPGVTVHSHEVFYDETSESILENVDFVIDAIDTISSKLIVIKDCLALDIPFISSLGMGNRLDPTQVIQTTLEKTSYDPLAKSLRKMVRDANIDLKSIPVVFSKEQPIRQSRIINEKGVTRKEKMPPASMFLVPPTAGLVAVSYCINSLIKPSKS